MNKKNLFFVTATLGLSCLIWPLKELYSQYTLYSWGIALSKEIGSEKITSGELYELAQQALQHINVSCASLITMYKTDECTCSTSYHMWINEKALPGPVEFDVVHEVAHIALGHPTKRFFHEITPEEARAQEVEADLLAYQTLFELGRADIILERIKTLKKYIEIKAEEPDLDDHPSLETIYTFTCSFARSKGLEVV